MLVCHTANLENVCRVFSQMRDDLRYFWIPDLLTCMYGSYVCI